MISSIVCALMILQSCSAMSPLALNLNTNPGRSQGLSELFNDEIRNNEISNDDFEKNLEKIINNLPKEFDTDMPAKELDNSRIPDEANDIKSSTPAIVKPTVSTLPGLPNEILDQIIGSMADHQAPPHDSEETHDNLPTTTEPTEDPKNSGVVTKTKLKIKISLDRTKNDTTKQQEKQMDTNQIEKTPEFDEEQHLTNLWNRSVPVLFKNNKASIHPKVDLKDVYQVLPEISNLLKKLKQIHKEGHVTIIMLDPKSVRANKSVVKKTKICCELRHMLLINNSDKLHSTDITDSEPMPPISFPPASKVEDEQSPSEEEVEEHIHPDDVHSPWNHNEQTLVSNVLNNLHLFAKPQHLSALSFNPKHVLQNKKPLTLLHLRIKISAPVKIRGNAANSFHHQDNIFPEPQFPEPELQHSGSYENELQPIDNNFGSQKPGSGSPKLIHLKFKIPLDGLHEIMTSQHSGSNENDLPPVNSFEWNRPPTAAPSPKVLHMKFNLHHGESFRIPDIPSDILHETPFAPHSQPAFPLVKEMPLKKPTMVYFIMHKHPKQSPPELESFLKDVFQIPGDTRNSIPAHEFVPQILRLPDIPQAVFRHPFQDSLSYRQSDHPFGVEQNHHLQKSERNDFERMMESIGNTMEEMEHSTEGINNNFIENHFPTPPMRSFSPFHAESANLPRRFEPAGDSEDHQNIPFEILKMFNTDGLNLFPSQGKFSASDREH